MHDQSNHIARSMSTWTSENFHVECTKQVECGCGCAEAPYTLQARFQLKKIAKMEVFNLEIIVLIMSFTNDPWLWHATCSHLFMLWPAESLAPWLMVQQPRSRHVGILVLSTYLFWGEAISMRANCLKGWALTEAIFGLGFISRSWSCKTCMGTFTSLFTD